MRAVQVLRRAAGAFLPVSFAPSLPTRGSVLAGQCGDLFNQLAGSRVKRGQRGRKQRTRTS